MSRSAFDRGLWDGCGKELPFCKARFNPPITLFEGWDLLPRLDLSRDSSGISDGSALSMSFRTSLFSRSDRTFKSEEIISKANGPFESGLNPSQATKTFLPQGEAPPFP
ncbi:hypothetical protein ACSQ67_010264 [Phaseolus vulgaris]